MQTINQPRSQVSLFRVSTVEETDDDNDDEYIKKEPKRSVLYTKRQKLSIRRRPDSIPVEPHVLHLITVLSSVRSHADAEEAIA